MCVVGVLVHAQYVTNSAQPDPCKNMFSVHAKLWFIHIPKYILFSLFSLVKPRPCYHIIGGIIGHLFRFVLPFIHEIWNTIWLNEQWPLLDGYYEWRTKEYTILRMIYDTHLTYDRYASAWAEQCHFILYRYTLCFEEKYM